MRFKKTLLEEAVEHLRDFKPWMTISNDLRAQISTLSPTYQQFLEQVPTIFLNRNAKIDFHGNSETIIIRTSWNS